MAHKSLEKKKAYGKMRRERDKEKITKWRKLWLDKNKDYYKNYRQRDEVKKKNKEYYRKYVRKNPRRKYNAASLECYRRDRKKNKKHWKARRMVQYYVSMGKIFRPNNCSNCKIDCKPQGHHPDYDKPLEVIWLCQKCHNVIHEAK